MEELRRRVRSFLSQGPTTAINMLNLRPCNASQTRAYYNSEAEHELLGVTSLKANLTQIRAEYNNMVSTWEHVNNLHHCPLSPPTDISGTFATDKTSA